MKVSLSGFLALIITCAFLSNTSQAQVVQSAKSALSVDLFADKPSAKKKKPKMRIEEPKTREEKTNKNQERQEKQKEANKNKNKNKNTKPEKLLYSAPVVENPNAGYGYTQKYADKLFPTYDGSVTFNEQNIPNKLIVKKDTVITLNLSDTENGFWISSFNKQVLQDISSKNYPPKNNIQIKAIRKGGSSLKMEFIEKQGDKHKVTKNIRLNVYVE